VSPAASAEAAGQVVVQRGGAVQIVYTASTAELPDFSPSIRNAIQLAIELHPTVRGFPIRLNTVETSCNGDNTASATAIVGNVQNVAVLGNLCSAGMVSALPIYEAAGLLTISGSATSDALPALGPNVFNRSVVGDADGGTAWLETVRTLPLDRFWRKLYELRFGSAPTDFADLYFDAANLLFLRLHQVARVVGGRLVIDRAALARAVRATTGFPGVTCRITLDPATGNRLNEPAALARCGAKTVPAG
jgi:ABC-type branched-subunit amino acid transport system substrate-binding protein